MTYSSKAARLLALVPAILIGLTACQSDIAAPTTRGASGASRLVEPGQSSVTILDTVDAAGTRTTIAEYAAGVIQPVGDELSTSIGSVTIKTVIPAVFTSSKSCVTSTIVATDATTGWTSEVKKSGGCNKTIEVQFENTSTRQRAEFQFLMEPGKTRIDFGAVR
jgi:hypothetical protein